ncbi:MAG: LysM peptidoglycan-binding domain-containing protein [Chloroflexota bacterium]
MPTEMTLTRHHLISSVLFILAVSGIGTYACTRSAQPGINPWLFPGPNTPQHLTDITPTRTPFLPPTRAPGQPILTPTPDPPHNIPQLDTGSKQHLVQWGDTLGQIALLYNTTVEELVEVNQIPNPDWLEIGTLLTIPAPTPTLPGPDFKIIPDSELVYGPVSAYFDVESFVKQVRGYLYKYEETVDEETLSGAQIVQLVSQNYSVNPRLLLAVLEYLSHWVLSPQPDPTSLDYPIGWYDPNREGLYRQLAWAADQLNLGYYLWRVEAIGTWVLPDGTIVPIDPTINAGTAGVQHLFSKLNNHSTWEQAVLPTGLFATYVSMFGYPFDLAIEPLIPPDLQQPAMILPFEAEVPWAFTGGPHGGWDDGSAWAALDFAPPGDLGCSISPSWVTAMADGLVIRADHGVVIQDLDNDGMEQTGWTILYLHISSFEGVQAGVYLQAGERIGHPSCEGGFAPATHLHIARRYNGEWIPADGPIPFNLEGWVSIGMGTAYDGYLQRGNQTLEACECRTPENTIQR